MKDSQRKAMFAKMYGKNSKHYNVAVMQNSSFSDLKKKHVFLKYQNDDDGDGVVNIKDCKPLNPDRQGMLHDWNIKRLKKQEEKLEGQREKQQKKLEDTKDYLQQKTAVFNKKNSIKESMMKEKQAVINEINKEKSKAQKLKDAEKATRKELRKLNPVLNSYDRAATKIGEKVHKLSEERKRAVEKHKIFLASPEGKKQTAENEKKRKAIAKQLSKGLKKLSKNLGF